MKTNTFLTVICLAGMLALSQSCDKKDPVAPVGPETPETPDQPNPPAPAEPDPEDMIRWEFDEYSNEWEYSHQDNAATPHYVLENGLLKLWTTANTNERSKYSTIRRDFGEGTYTWKINIPRMSPGDQASIAGFLYKDDRHELDFEIGYGKDDKRAACGAKGGDYVACMTNQANPNISNYTPISAGWHVFSIKLEVVGGRYKASWIIDGEVKQEQQLEFGPETTFRIFCSVENLSFMGTHLPTMDTVGEFDYVTYQGPAALIREQIYTHTFKSGDFGLKDEESAEKDLPDFKDGDVTWKIELEADSPFYYMNPRAGLMIGRAWGEGQSARSATLSSSDFGAITSVAVKTARFKPETGTDNAEAEVSVWVDGKQYGKSQKIVNDMEEYRFQVNPPAKGKLEVKWKTTNDNPNCYFLNAIQVNHSK